MDTGHVRRASARRGMLLVAAGAASWGTIGVAVSVLYRIAVTDALSISFLRLALAAPVLLVLSSTGAGRPLHHIARRDLAVMCLMGAGYAAYQLCYFAAIARIGVALAVVLNICSGPIFIALLARGFLGERMTVAMGTALGGALCGTVLVVAAPGKATAAGSLLGAGLALGAGVSYAVVTVCARQVAPRYHPVQPLAVGFGVGALLLLPLVLRSGLALTYSPVGWLLLVHIALVPTVVGYTIYLWGLRGTSANSAAVLTLLEPLVSTILATVLLGEQVTAVRLLGGVLLAGSVGLLVVQHRSEGQARGPARGARGTQP